MENWYSKLYDKKDVTDAFVDVKLGRYVGRYDTYAKYYTLLFAGLRIQTIFLPFYIFQEPLSWWYGRFFFIGPIIPVPCV